MEQGSLGLQSVDHAPYLSAVARVYDGISASTMFDQVPTLSLLSADVHLGSRMDATHIFENC